MSLMDLCLSVFGGNEKYALCFGRLVMFGRGEMKR
jgi:hypothetical protein